MARFQTQLSLFAERKGGGEKGDIRYLQDYLDSGDFSNDRGKEGIEIFFFSMVLDGIRRWNFFL